MFPILGLIVLSGHTRWAPPTSSGVGSGSLTVSEKITVSRFRDRLHSGMPQPSFNGNSKEAFPHRIEPADELYAVVPARLLFHRRRRREEPHSGLAEHFQ